MELWAITGKHWEIEMDTRDSQIFDSYLPVYNVVPEKWEDARPLLVEILKKYQMR
jgi:hypothetical protein